MVPDHGTGVAAPTGEDGQPAAAVVFPQERLDHLPDLPRIQDGQERMQGPVGVPHRKVIIVRRFSHVTHGPWEQRGPPEGAIEMGAHSFVSTTDIHPGEALFPEGSQRFPDGLEVPSRDFGLQVGTGTLLAAERAGGLYQVGSFLLETKENMVSRVRVHEVEIGIGFHDEIAVEARQPAFPLIDTADG